MHFCALLPCRDAELFPIFVALFYGYFLVAIRYNTSETSAELNRNGIPHGFKSAPPEFKVEAGLTSTPEPVFPIMVCKTDDDHEKEGIGHPIDGGSVTLPA